MDNMQPNYLKVSHLTSTGTISLINSNIILTQMTFLNKKTTWTLKSNLSQSVK